MSIAVAVSGGVDSLLALRLLKERGEDVMAVHAHFLPDNVRDRTVLNRLSGICSQIQVPFYVLDLRQTFHKLVIEPFVQDYIQGLTPNPCNHCNQSIKFGVLLKEAQNLGARYLATGHYATKGLDDQSRPALCRGADRYKEQSYFLSLLSRDQLANACFPLGCWFKRETYQVFRSKFGHEPPAKESQEICFIPGDDYRAFLEEFNLPLPPPGPVQDSSGLHLGSHRGLHHYTIGQRRGLGIAHSEPLYVLKKDTVDNILVVGPGRELNTGFCLVKDLNFLVDLDQWPDIVQVQTNYRQKPVPVQVSSEGDTLKVIFQKPAKRGTPGQIAAFYSPKGRVLGAGVIYA